jgi:acetylornithine deacetylase/succinyl-diaminopimelate desuccinylase-like protein
MPPAPLDAVLAHLDQDRDAAIDRLSALLRIPSVGAQPDHYADCDRAALWLSDTLTGLGFRAEVLPTAGRPVVLAHHDGTTPGAPRVLFYGHYDVQPAEPLELWDSPPFEPTVATGPNGPMLVARGAVDDKGQVACFLEAVRAWHAVAGGPPVPLTVVLEGEEEVGSTHLNAFLEAHRDRLGAEVAVISDTNMWNADTPALTTRLRGLCYVQIDLHGPGRDLHSGLYGGSAQNPLNVLTGILGALRDADGRIQIPGFYDAVLPPSAAETAAWAALGFDEAAFLAGIGLQAPAGERGLPALDRMWARPTADVNGIWGGYAGPGTKTVIPAEAGAKLSFRLVPDQDPAAILAGLQRFITERLPAGMRVEVQEFGLAPGFALPADSRFVTLARDALTEEWGREAALIGSGGSIPVVESLRRILGLETVLMGFGLESDQVHSPNEKFDLRCFHGGARSHARLLGKLAG